MFEPLLVALAREVAVWFPELEGRSIAVSEVDPFNDKTNIPTLPLAFTALLAETGTQGANGGGNIVTEEDVLVHFLFEPVKYNRQDGAETPFFAFYDYEEIRDRLLVRTKHWRSPRNGSISYVSLDVSSTEFAVALAFRFTVTTRWCAPKEIADEAYEHPRKVTIVHKVVQAQGRCDPVDCPEEPDPCDFARERNPFGINDKPNEPFDWE